MSEIPEAAQEIAGAIIMQCWENRELRDKWAKLRGISFPDSPIAVAIDQATGHDKAIIEQFAADMFDLVVTRLPRDAWAEIARRVAGEGER